MKYTLAIFILFVLALSLQTQAQKGSVRGHVVDSRSGANVEYATVALLKASDSSLVTGTVTDSRGNFTAEVSYGTYLVRVSFIGYKTYFHPATVRLSANNASVNLGKIQVSPSAKLMDEVTVSAERTMVEYQLDKRVVNVDKNIVSSGGTATDVLEQVPSVAIDNDGNVTLRGSTNVKVLVNGRPSELLASDLTTLLEQIPASTVETIEVITNPSAKYDPEGMSGIINIKLKDRTSGTLGLNGVVNLNGGAPLPFMIPDQLPQFIPNAMGNVSLNYSTKKYNITFNADAGLRQRANRGFSDIARKRNGDTLSYDQMNQFSLNPGRMGSAKLGFEYYIDSTSSILLSYQLRGGMRDRLATVVSTDLFNNGLYSYTQYDSNLNSNTNQVANLHYDKRFSNPDQQLSADVSFSWRSNGGQGWQEQLYDVTASNLERYYLRETGRDNHGRDLNIQLNYTHPFSPALKLETGYEGRLRWTRQRYTYYYTQYDAAGVLQRELDSASTMHYNYDQQVHAVYATLGWKASERLSAQVGLRGEYWTVQGSDLLHPLQAPVDKSRPELYPTVHASYQISKDQSFQVSYSRRVRRPHMWDLHPSLDIRQGMEMGFGNPGLDPEFTNAFELSYNLGFGQTNIFASAYFRQTNNMMTRYGFVWDSVSAVRYSPWITYNPEYDGYWASTWQNLNRGINYGAELIIDHQIAKWWKLNLSINAFESYIEPTELISEDATSLFRVDVKLNSYMTLPDNWTVQFSAQYRSPFEDLQTTMHSSYWADLAVKKDICQRRGTLSLRIGDVFCTGGWGHSTHNSQLDREYKGRRISPTVMLGFSWKINGGTKPNMKQQQEESYDNGGDDSGGEY